MTQVTQARSGDRVIARNRVIGKQTYYGDAEVLRKTKNYRGSSKTYHRGTEPRAKSQELKANGQQLAADRLLQ